MCATGVQEREPHAHPSTYHLILLSLSLSLCVCVWGGGGTEVQGAHTQCSKVFQHVIESSYDCVDVLHPAGIPHLLCVHMCMRMRVSMHVCASVSTHTGGGGCNTTNGGPNVQHHMSHPVCASYYRVATGPYSHTHMHTHMHMHMHTHMHTHTHTHTRAHTRARARTHTHTLPHSTFLCSLPLESCKKHLQQLVARYGPEVTISLTKDSFQVRMQPSIGGGEDIACINTHEVSYVGKSAVNRLIKATCWRRAGGMLLDRQSP